MCVRIPTRRARARVTICISVNGSDKCALCNVWMLIGCNHASQSGPLLSEEEEGEVEGEEEEKCLNVD